MKIYQILSKLDLTTLNRVKKFVNSEFFNTNSKVSRAFFALHESIAMNTTLSKFDLWNKIHSDQKYNDQSLRKITHQLTALLQDFFVVENTMKHDYKRKRAISEYSQEHNIPELKTALQKKLTLAIDNDDLMWSESFYDLYTSYRYLIDVDGDFEKKKNYKNTTEFTKNLTSLEFLLDTSYSIEKIRLALVKNNYSQLFSDKTPVTQNIPIQDLDSIMDTSKSRLLKVHKTIYKLLVEEEEGFNMTDILKYLAVLAPINKKEAATLYDYIHNYLARKINSGQKLYQEWFDLMKFGLESKILIEGGKIDPTDFRNISLSASRVKKFEWSLNFIEDYKDYLNPEHKQSAYSFSKARIFNNMGNHEGVVEVLRNVEYEDITYNLNSRLLLIAAFYELDEFDALDSTIKAFKVFLRRKRNISVKRKANFRDFCDVVYNLMKAGDRKDASRISKANEIMDSNKGIPSSWWLKEKIAEASQVLGIKPEKVKNED